MRRTSRSCTWPSVRVRPSRRTPGRRTRRTTAGTPASERHTRGCGTSSGTHTSVPASECEASCHLRLCGLSQCEERFLEAGARHFQVREFFVACEKLAHDDVAVRRENLRGERVACRARDEW